MKVYLATRVLSASVANAFEGRSDTQSKQKFVHFMDRFFDYLNVTKSIKKTSKPVKPSLRPYSSADDWRFKWLEETFLGFFDEWEQEVESTPNVTTAMKKQMCLSQETLTGICTTVNSFVQLGKHLLTSVPGFKYLLSDKFNQDPHEEYFSRQRGIGRSYDNPTVEQFGQNMLSIYVAGSSIHASNKGNCKSTNNHYLDETPLPHK